MYCALQREIRGYRNIRLGAHNSEAWDCLGGLTLLEPGCALSLTFIITAENVFPLREASLCGCGSIFWGGKKGHF